MYIVLTIYQRLKKENCRAQNSILFTNLSRQINSKMFQRKALLQNRNCETKLQYTNGADIFEDGRLSIQQNFQQN